MRKLVLSLAAVVASFGLAAGTEAAMTATGTVNVTATLVSSCTVKTTAVNFGTIADSSNLTAAGDVTVNCRSGVPYVIALDAGLHMGASRRRIMDSAGNAIEYTLNSPASREWGDYNYGNTYPADIFGDYGTGYDQPHAVSGNLFLSGSSLPDGTYTDTVTVTVHY